MSKKQKIKHNAPAVAAGGEKSAAPVQRGSFLQSIAVIVKERNNRLCWVFFALLWSLLVFYEPALLFRIEELSSFLFTEPFFNEFLAVPAGMLSYAGAFLVQFFYYPVLGATIYTLLLIAVYALTKRVFDIPSRYSIVALLPVVALVASNMQLGYWIFYLKLPGYFYVALLAVIVSLFAIWAFKKMPGAARLPFVAVWVFAAYPIMGIYASAAAVVMAVYGLAMSVKHRGGYLLPLLVAVLVILLVIFVPRFYYYYYVTISDEYIYWAGTPSYQWDNAVYAKVQHEEASRWFDTRFYWVPFLLLFFFYLMFPIASALKKQLLKCKRLQLVASVAVVLFSSLFLYSHWFTDNNFRVESGALNETFGSLTMYYHEKDTSDRVYVKRADSDEGVVSPKDYKYNSATSMFYISMTDGETANSEYCTFATLQEDSIEVLQALQTAIEEYYDDKDDFTEEHSLLVDADDAFVGDQKTEVKYNVPVKPIVIKKVEVTSY